MDQKLIPHRSVREILYGPAGGTHRRYIELDAQVPHLGNVFEQDTFVWFADAAESDKGVERIVSQLLLSLAEQVDNVRLATMRQDFLQVFYQQFFDPAARRALGEFYTNRAIVRETLDAIGFDGTNDGTLIDISCGSGNFLVEAIARRIEIGKGTAKASLLKSITENTLGVDIHPLAVAMARVNYLISISNLLAPGTIIQVPIYWADSLARLVAPKKTRRLPTFGVPVTVLVPGLKTFELPDPREVNWDKLLDTTRDLLHGRKGKVTVAQLWDRFSQELGQELSTRFEQTLKSFLTQIIELHNEGRDMRWLPLLRNVLLIEGLKGRCRFVVGNPPWVRIHNIEEEFRARVNQDYRFCRDAGWERGCKIANIGRGFARQTDLCIPFVERSLELLEEGGHLGYVITSKIQQALYANALRRELIQNKTIVRLVDYSLSSVRLFVDAVNYPMILAVKNIAPPQGHKVVVTIHNASDSKVSYDVSQVHLGVLQDDVESPWLMAADVIPVLRKLQANGSMLASNEALVPRMGVKTAANSDYIVKEILATDVADESAAINDYGEQFRVESELIYPVLRGENIVAWHYEVRDRILWTHDPETGEVLTKLPQRARKYFSEPKRVSRLKKRQDYDTAKPHWVIFRSSPEKLKQKVCWCELSHTMEACYVPSHWNDPVVGTKKLIPLQTAYLIPVSSARTGLLLTALLNSLPFRAQMVAFAERARGAYFRHFSWTVGLGFIPRAVFDQLNTKFVSRTSTRSRTDALIRLAKQLHRAEQPEEQERLQRELDKLVSQEYGLSEDETNNLARYFDFMHPPIAAEPVPAELIESQE